MSFNKPFRDGIGTCGDGTKAGLGTICVGSVELIGDGADGLGLLRKNG